MTNSQSTMRFALIMYKQDFDSKESYEKKRYQISEQGLRNYYHVGIADGGSTKFLLSYCYAKLDEVIEDLDAPGWTGVRKFKELLLCLGGNAKSECEV